VKMMINMARVVATIKRRKKEWGEDDGLVWD
jgi:hypothetical protein